MISQAWTIIILAATLTLAGVLYLLGCVLSKNWYPLFTIFPALLTLFFVYGFIQSEPSGGWSDSKISEDAWLFLLVFGITACIGLPCVLYHVRTLNATGFWLHFAGDIVVGIGVGVYIYLTRMGENEFKTF